MNWDDQVHSELTYEFNLVCVLYRWNMVSYNLLAAVEQSFGDWYIARTNQRLKAFKLNRPNSSVGRASHL